MMSVKLTNSVAIILLVAISPWSVLASRQGNGNDIAAIERPLGGFVIVWNRPDLHFTIELKGKKVEPDDSAPNGTVAFNIDGIVLPVQCTAISDFAKNARKQKLTDLAILEAHRDWESRYQEQNLGAKINVASAPQQLSGGGEALMWKFDMPKAKKPVEQVYLTTVSGKSVVILNGVVTGKIPEKAVQKLLLDTISTLNVSSRPIDVQKLREGLQGWQPKSS
jgi:hypothetical protein